MSATISDKVMMKEVLKATGFDCPQGMENKTFKQATSGGGSSGGGATITKQLSAQEIRDSSESGQAITPPEGYAGFSEITFPSFLMQEKEIVKNETLEFGTGPAPYFLKKLTVNVPSSYTLETLSLNKDSDPVTISYEGKTFVFLGKIDSSGTLTGLGGEKNSLLNPKTVDIMSAGAIAGEVKNNPDTKTLTYTPNTSFNRGSVRITKVII